MSFAVQALRTLDCQEKVQQALADKHRLASPHSRDHVDAQMTCTTCCTWCFVTSETCISAQSSQRKHCAQAQFQHA